jgi:hypothetical protein
MRRPSSDAILMMVLAPMFLAFSPLIVLALICVFVSEEW